MKNGHKYIFMGQFNTGDDWEESADNRQQVEFIIKKITENRTVLEGWEIRDNLGRSIYIDGQGFADTPHPKYLEELMEARA